MLINNTPEKSQENALQENTSTPEQIDEDSPLPRLMSLEKGGFAPWS